MPSLLTLSENEKKKFYWNTVMLIHLQIISGCFLAKTTELRSCDRALMAHKA